ncbi:MAG: hypothetical protein FJ303_00770 [Planctomycetes bacterium]|nr:hypothetical protein [Planctomycetota bacterium]
MVVQWMLHPHRPVDVDRDVSIMSAKRWPTVLSKADLQAITGEATLPRYLNDTLDGEDLHYYCNSLVNYSIQGVHVRLNVLWDFESSIGGGDTHFAVFRGSRSRVEVRQGQAEKFQPELFITPNRMMDYGLVRRAVELRVQAIQPEYPGISVIDLGTHFRIAIPTEFRVGHEAHFAQVTKQFLRYVRGQDPLPAWEKANMMAKYFTTTRGVEASRTASNRGR